MSKIVELIDRHHQEQTDTQRGHMGCSILGNPCERALWYLFRWTFKENFPGRIRRLFRRGHNEEQTIVSDLRKIGIDIRDVGNNQARVEFGGHVSGSIDGVIKSGVPGHETEQFIAEFKTHNQKSFDGVSRQGVQKSKPGHYAQMQVYMLGKEIHKSLYIAINKNNDEMYTEIVEFDKEYAERLLRKGEWISLADEAPPRISKDPTWFACKFCPAKHICHGGKPTKQINCRTCAHSEPKPNGTWTCNRHHADNIPEDFQHKGCEDHILHRDVVPWTRMEGDDNNVVTFEINGQFIKNGNGKDCFASSELVSNVDACLNPDEFIENLRSDFGGKISG